MSQKIQLEMARLCLEPLFDSVLIALADEANDAGLVVDVDIAWIASKIHLGPDVVITVLGQLLTMGLIQPLMLSGLGRHFKCYQLDLDWPIESDFTGPTDSSRVHTEAPLDYNSSSYSLTSVKDRGVLHTHMSVASVDELAAPASEFLRPATDDAGDSDGPVPEEIAAFLSTQFAEAELAHNKEVVIAEQVAEKVKTGPAFKLLPPGEPLIRKRRQPKYDGPPIPGELFPLIYRVCFLADTPNARMLLTGHQRGRCANVLAKLLSAGFDPFNLSEFEKWWANNFRSKDRNDPNIYVPPRPEQVLEFWSEAMNKRATDYNNPTLIEQQDNEADVRISRAIMQAHATEERSQA